MGLLTDPTTEENTKKTFIVKYHGKLCLVMILSSVAWLCFLAHDNFSASTYFSENALLPGLVQGDYSENSEAQTVLTELQAEAEANRYSIPADFLIHKFHQLYMEAYVQNFTLNNPLRENVKFTGKNVYGILRAPRSASLEALVLSVPYRPLASVYPTTLPGLALMFSLAKYFRRQKYWAKDIIFLITEHEQLGVQAWLDAYHGTSSGAKGVVDQGVLEEHSGAIQAALNLEIHAARISHIDVKVAGLNGQLPNLDLVNLVHRICSKEGVRNTFYNKDSKAGMRYSTWNHKLRTMLEMIATQATGVPDGNHGLFHRFGIEAVTLEGHAKVGKGGQTFYHMGRVLEGLFRSLNNLLERFHQSYFFYLLPSTDRYISIGLYMPSLVLLVSALYLKSFATWLKLHINDDGKKISKNSLKAAKNLNIMVVSAVVLGTHVVGVLTISIANFLVKKLTWSSETSLLFSYVTTSILFAIIFAASMKRCQPNENWILLNVICLTELGTFLLCISMHNFSFGFVTALIYVLPSLWISASNNRWYKKLVWLIFHPLFIIYWITLATTWYNFDELTVIEILMKSFDAMKHLIALNVTDAMVYGNWTFVVINTVLLPTWLTFWALLNAPFKVVKDKRE
ncbi:glycosylphosphatidylinositol anchor attachment 1 protein [Planococcus citri]|uniref:glycosylphosphatidylinositol anchor attachment 1 protein n=1 Tax=Planococcus citri TaxID=170843 RepID=UPI0031F7E584